jgi:hypothetical protein
MGTRGAVLRVNVRILTRDSVGDLGMEIVGYGIREHVCGVETGREPIKSPGSLSFLTRILFLHQRKINF